MRKGNGNGWRFVGLDDLLEYVKKAIEDFKRYGIRPTVRLLFYRLADTYKVIQHSHRAYKNLDAHLTKWRNQGLIPYEDIADEERKPLPGEPVITTLGSFRDEVAWHIQYLLESLERIAEVPMWYGQKHYIEIWVEKKGGKGLFEWTNQKWKVTVFASKGYTSVTALYEAAQRLRDAAQHGKKPVILYFGDWDPSGLDIDRHIKHYLREVFKVDVEVVRVALTPELAARYKLPTIPPDDPNYKRCLRDPRYPRFKELCERYGIEPNVIELESIINVNPQVFKELVDRAIERYFDREVYQRVKELERERREWIPIVREILQRVLEELSDENLRVSALRRRHGLSETAARVLLLIRELKTVRPTDLAREYARRYSVSFASAKVIVSRALRELKQKRLVDL